MFIISKNLLGCSHLLEYLAHSPPISLWGLFLWEAGGPLPVSSERGNFDFWEHGSSFQIPWVLEPPPERLGSGYDQAHLFCFPLHPTSLSSSMFASVICLISPQSRQGWQKQQQVSTLAGPHWISPKASGDTSRLLLRLSQSHL